MIHWPRGRHEWIIAVASALSGFFFGGAAIALVQRYLSRLLRRLNL